MSNSDEDLLIQCDSLISLIFYREKQSLTTQTIYEMEELLRKLRPRTNAIVVERRRRENADNPTSTPTGGGAEVKDG